MDNPRPWLVSQVHAHIKLIDINPAYIQSYNSAWSKKLDLGNCMLVPDVPILVIDSGVVDPTLCKRRLCKFEPNDEVLKNRSTDAS
jgi:hypothetical protein